MEIGVENSLPKLKVHLPRDRQFCSFTSAKRTQYLTPLLLYSRKLGNSNNLNVGRRERVKGGEEGICQRFNSSSFAYEPFKQPSKHKVDMN